MSFYGLMDRDVISEEEIAQQSAEADIAQARFLITELAKVNPGFKSQHFYAQLIAHIRNDVATFGCEPVCVKEAMLSALDDCHDCVEWAGRQ